MASKYCPKSAFDYNNFSGLEIHWNFKFAIQKHAIITKIILMQNKYIYIPLKFMLNISE